jgi:imidazole glycerol-phosphate synthase subunit HisH
MKKTSLGILDYGMGNLYSIQHALNYIGIDSELVKNASTLKKFSHIILPGVGSCAEAYTRLLATGFADEIINCIEGKTNKILGICVGMQVLCSSTEEGGGSIGLNVFPNKVKLISTEEVTLKIPHVGFNEVSANHSYLLKNIHSRDFYFVHSYCVEKENASYEVGMTEYGNEFVSLIESENVFATQFHPEKSQHNGLKLLANFVSQ